VNFFQNPKVDPVDPIHVPNVPIYLPNHLFICKVASAAPGESVSFLINEKGLSLPEVSEALRRVRPGSPEAALVDSDRRKSSVFIEQECVFVCVCERERVVDLSID
jgi:hypothetical protein